MSFYRYFLAAFCLGLVACQSPPSQVSESNNTSTPNPVTPVPTETIPLAPAPTVTLNVPSDSKAPPNSAVVVPTQTPAVTLPPQEPSVTQPPVSPTPETVQPSPKAVNKGSATFQSPDLGIKFDYPSSYIVEADKQKSSVDVWQSQDYQAVKSGKFANAEPPGNLNISVAANPQKLPLDQWIEQSAAFESPENFSETRVGGKPAVKFNSTGLLEFEHIVIPSQDNSRMVVISHPQGQGQQRVFQQIISSLQIN